MSRSSSSANPEPRREVPDAVITSVKNNTSFLSLLKNYGIAVKKVGNGYKAVCPFHSNDGHSEKDPSFSINPITNLGHCFGCGTGLNVIQFVQQMEKITFPQAVEKLLALKGGCDYASERTQEAAKGKVPETPQPTEEERQAILREVIATTTAELRNSEAARKYLEARGLDPLKLLESYNFGYWNGKLYGGLDGSEKKKLAALGLINGSSRSLFENCILFPLEKAGRITTVYGRKATVTSSPDASTSASTCRHYLLPCKREGLYLPHAGLNPRKPVIITESIIDALSLFTAGVTNVLPLLGVNGFLSDHLAYLKEQSFPAIYIVLNGDNAGNKAAAQLRQNLAAAKLPSEIVMLPDGKDVNDLLRELGPNKLAEWFLDASGQKAAASSQQEKPTVWEDEAGTSTYVLYGDREYRLQGLVLYGMDRLRANIKVYRVSDKGTFHLDTLDLYQSRSREHFITSAAKALAVESQTIAHDINSLITLLEELRLRKKEEGGKPKVYTMSEEEKREAIEYLRSPDLLDRIAADIEACGVVGNRKVSLVAFIGAASRLTSHPLGILFESRSAGGKSKIQEIIAAFTPEESLNSMTRLTGQSLFYEKDGLKHKLLSIEEDDGMRDALYAIRVLLSSQRLSVRSLKTDPKSGEFKTYNNEVHGPASVMIATTNPAAFDHETATRFLMLHLDESAEQTQRIMDYQDRMAGGERIKLHMMKTRICTLHRNVLRMVKPLCVLNRIGVGVHYPPQILHSRREKAKLATLIETVALLHQYQRPIKEEKLYGMSTSYIEVTQEDVDVVQQIAGDILRESLDDTPKPCRDLLGFIHDMVNEKHAAAERADARCERWQISFTRKELMERCRWSRWHLEEHLKELEEAGYITQRMGKKGQKYAYGLIDETLPPLPEINSSFNDSI